MRKEIKIGFIGVFCAVIGLAFPIFNIFSKQLSMDSHENRLLTGLPQVLHSPLRELPRNLDNFLVDNSPFRYQFVLVNAGLDYALFGTSQSDQVLPGRKGWLFYKDGPNAAQPMANYQGLTELNDSAEVLAEASAGLQILNDRLAENGCTLVLDLTPSKDRIYREYMPDGYPIVNEQNRTDLLAAYLQSHTTVPVVWRYDLLRSQARQNPDRLLYYKTDTHWNAVGALYGLDGIFEALDMPILTPESYPVEADGTTTGIWPMWRRFTPACRPSRPTRCPATQSCSQGMIAPCGSSATRSVSITCRTCRRGSQTAGASISTPLRWMLWTIPAATS